MENSADDPKNLQKPPEMQRESLGRRSVGVDPQLHGLRWGVRVGQGQEALLVAGIGRVGHELSQKDVLETGRNQHE